MCKFAREDVTEDFCIAVRMGGETGSGGYSIFIQNAKSAERFKLWVVVAGEGEGVLCVEPSMIGFPSSVGTTRDDFCVREV